MSPRAGPRHDTSARGSFPRRGFGGVACPARGAHLQVKVALLREADVGDDGPRRPVRGAIREGGDALVERDRGVRASRSELRRDGGGATARRLLVVPEGEPHGPSRPAVALEQVLHGLELADEHALDVEGSPAPYPLLVHVAGERRALPGVRGRNGDDVEMSEQQDARKAGVYARHRHEQRAADCLNGAEPRDGRVPLAHQSVETQERGGVLASRNRGKRDGGRQATLGSRVVKVRAIALMGVVGVDVHACRDQASRAMVRMRRTRLSDLSLPTTSDPAGPLSSRSV